MFRYSDEELIKYSPLLNMYFISAELLLSILKNATIVFVHKMFFFIKIKPLGKYCAKQITESTVIKLKMNWNGCIC